MRAVEVALAKRARLAIELQKLDDFLAMAKVLEQEGAPEASLVETSTSPPNGELERPTSFGRPSIRQRVEEAVMAELTQYGARSTRDLLIALTAKGIDPAPRRTDFDDKRNVLSTMLSKAKHRFTNDRAARVWRMAQPIDRPGSLDITAQRGEPP